MKLEDIEFLKKLKEELLTQDTDCQAAPRFWGVMETKRIYRVLPDAADGSELVLGFEEGFDTVEEAKAFLINEDVDITEKDLESIETFDDLIEYFGYDRFEDAQIIHYKEEERLSEQTGCFLTKKACKEHIRLNDYHYKNPKTYAMTAWRNPEFERLMKIVVETDWDNIIDGKGFRVCGIDLAAETNT